MKIYRVIRSRRRTLGLEIDHSGRLIVRAPLLMLEKTWQRMIQTKEAWIKAKIAEIKAQHLDGSVKQIIEGEVFLFLGQNYPLKVVDNLELNLEFDIDSGLKIRREALSQAEKLIIKWYQREALKAFRRRVNFLALKYEFSYGKLAISRASKRWGSCTHQNDIRLNWRLILAPPEISDYVIIHELVHTKIKDHSRTFWLKVASLYPDYRGAKKWLHQNSAQLYFSFT